MDLQNDYKSMYQLRGADHVKATKSFIPLLSDNYVKYVGESGELDPEDFKFIYEVDGRFFTTLKSDPSHSIEFAIFSFNNERLLGRLDAQPSEEYLWFIGDAGSSVTVTIPQQLTDVNIEVSTDKETWEPAATGAVVNLGSSKTYFRNTAATLSTESYQVKLTTSGSNIKIGGKIDSMIGKASPTSYCFCRLFASSFGLVDATELILPRKIPADASDVYAYMFSGCADLTAAPKLPTKILSIRCYSGMFYNCTSLETAPALPATVLANGCYNSMFYGCSALKTAPALPVTELTQFCYAFMFNSCSSLEKAPDLPAEMLVGSCYIDMFNGCTSLNVPPQIAATDLWAYSEACLRMFKNCSALKVSNVEGSGTKFFHAAAVGTKAATDMFAGTGGTFTDTPVAGQTYFYY